MNRWKLTFQYDGTEFHGWQKQPETRTVQGEIENALSVFCREEIQIMGQGRTDAGVHALAQIAHADLPESTDTEKLLHAMKGLLPEDVALTAAELTSPDFHARFDATSRQYRYQWITSPQPLHRKTAWQYYSEPDPLILDQTAKLVTGEHDFIGFCIPPDDDMLTTICEVTFCEWRCKESMWILEIRSNRFLRHMVRRLAGEMVHAATGRTGITEFEELLAGNVSHRKGFSAPPHGLLLTSVHYK